MWLRRSDIIVVTGGGNGLGAQMVRRFALDGFSVVALDISLPPDEQQFQSVLYIKCNITDIFQLEAARDQIEKDIGTPTVLINNAGIRKDMEAIVNTELASFEQTIDVNLTGAFRALKVFVPGMIARERGFIVNVASALGFISPAGLSSYGASKAGILGLHESLLHENSRYSFIRFLLVCPGQIDTSMFDDVATPSSILAPIISQYALAGKIVNFVETGKTGRLYTPLYVSILPLMRVLPQKFAKIFRDLSGVDQAAGSV